MGFTSTLGTQHPSPHKTTQRHVCLVQPKGAWTRWPVPAQLQTPGSRPGHPSEQPRRPRPRPAGAGAAHPLTQSWSQFRSQLRLSARPASRAGLLLLPHLVLGLTPPSGLPLGALGRADTVPPPPPPPQPRTGGRTAQDTPTTHRPRDVAEDLVGRGVPVVRTGLGAKQAGQLPGAILSADEGRGSQPGPQAGRGDPETQPRAAPPHLLPFSEGFLEKEALSLLEAWGTQWLFPMGGSGGGGWPSERSDRSGSLGPEPLAPTSWGGAGSVCLVPKHRRGWSLSGRDDSYLGPAFQSLALGPLQKKAVLGGTGSFPNPAQSLQLSLPLVKDGPPSACPARTLAGVSGARARGDRDPVEAPHVSTHPVSTSMPI